MSAQTHGTSKVLATVQQSRASDHHSQQQRKSCAQSLRQQQAEEGVKQQDSGKGAGTATAVAEAEEAGQQQNQRARDTQSSSRHSEEAPFCTHQNLLIQVVIANRRHNGRLHGISKSAIDRVLREKEITGKAHCDDGTTDVDRVAMT